MKLNLSACLPFSLRAVIESHGWAQLPPFSIANNGDVLSRVELLESGRVVEFVIREAGGGVTVETRGYLAGAEREEISRKVWWMLGLGEDLGPFYALARQEPRLSAVETQARGRLLRCPTVFEDMVKTILTTNTTWSGTIRMVEALVARFGTPLPTDPSRNAFPHPAQLAASNETDLRQIGLGYRAPYIAQLARQVAAGDLDLERLKRHNSDLTAEQVRSALLKIKGVGEYAAASLMMLLGYYDYIPVDSWARRLVSHEWYDNQPVGRPEIEAAFAQWSGWKGLVYWLWDWKLETP